MWGGPSRRHRCLTGHTARHLREEKSVMTYSVLMGLASQREEQIAARARLPRLERRRATTHVAPLRTPSTIPEERSA